MSDLVPQQCPGVRGGGRGGRGGRGEEGEKGRGGRHTSKEIVLLNSTSCTVSSPVSTYVNK